MYGFRVYKNLTCAPTVESSVDVFTFGCVVESFLKQHSQQLFHSFDIAAVIDREKHWVTFKFFHDDSHISLLLYRTLQPEYQYAHYLSEVKCFSNWRLLSRFRSGCHGLRIDTGRWENNVHLDRKDRLCLVCSSAKDMEDECLIALLMAPFELVMPIFFSVLVQYLAFLTIVKQMHVVDSLGTVFPKDQYFD